MEEIKKGSLSASEKVINQYAVNLNQLRDYTTKPLYPYFIFDNKIIGFYGKSGQGKTNAVLGVSRDLLKQGKIKRVLYFNADNGLDTFNERGVYNFDPNFILLDFADRDKKEIENALKSLCDDDLAGTLIVLDSLQDCVNGDISNAATMKPFMSLLIKLRKQTKATIIFICHTTKSSDKENAEEFNGHSCIKNNSDAFYYVDRIDDINSFSKELIYHFKSKKARNFTKDQILSITIPEYELKFRNDDIKAFLNYDMQVYFYELIETLKEQTEPISQGELINLWLKRIDRRIENNEKIEKYGLKKVIEALKNFAKQDKNFKLTIGKNNAHIYSYENE